MIRVLAATRVGQGLRASDFSHADEGELVTFGFVCDRDRKNPNPDGGCGCGRCLVGLLSHRGTTTFCVAEIDWTEEKFVDYVLCAAADMGWLRRKDDELAKVFRDDARDLLNLARRFPLGAVLEKRKNTIQMRQPKCERVANTP